MSIIDREARESMLKMLDRAARHANSAELPEQTIMEGGAVMALMSRTKTGYANGPVLHSLSLTFVAESEDSLSPIIDFVRGLAVK